ncbi:LA2681 family HEPN domain-containing protein [Maridesulfovibrio sp.]|uniref:LA2681 family HEPN domain-containing protein n=1 Tax=Maridesulfovibrio sp. TaxID=2795000 RepID=UPI0029CA9C9F|nr:LA2681 family HEPN domain-containing protein [Maridesulfovibrio sp.]
MLDSNNLKEMASEADELLLAKKHSKIEELLERYQRVNYVFESLSDEAQFYYTLGNCSQELFNYHNLDWFSDKLSKAVIFFRKALYVVRQIDFPSEAERYLKSCIATNLGNNLSSQGRAFCCIPFWDDALKYFENPVAIISKAQNELFIADVLYDQGHRAFHYFAAYQLINLGLKSQDQLYPEQKLAYSKESQFIKFKEWFEVNYRLEDFEYFETYEGECVTRKEKEYLRWCGDNKLFINDLNDVSCFEIAYQDILSLPSFSYDINTALTMHEKLMYHGNFDELKNDYCYARYLVFTARNIPSEQKHFSNSTYPHIEDMSHSITNLKASHYKSAFKTLYSLFDKIAYFMHRFCDLNDIGDDHKVDFDKVFKDLKSRKKWKPHTKLKSSHNCFIHALFFILKDIRDVDGSTVHRYLDPDAQEFFKIRNFIEHRSLKIVDDFGYTLLQSDKDLKEAELDKLEVLINDLTAQIVELNRKIDETKSDQSEEVEILEMKLEQALLKKHEKKKLSSHSMLISESEFKSRLMTLMRLVRNSIMYLSLAIHAEEQNKPDDGKVLIPSTLFFK